MNNNKDIHILSIVLGLIFITGIAFFGEYYENQGAGYIALHISTAISLLLVPLYNITKLTNYLLCITLTLFGAGGIVDIFINLCNIIILGDGYNIIAVIINISIIATIYIEIKLMYKKTKCRDSNYVHRY